MAARRRALAAGRGVARALAVSGLVLAAAVASPAAARSDAGRTAPAVQTAAAERLGATDDYRLALLKMKGYLGVARALLRQRAPGAGYYLAGPVRDIFRTAEAELERRDAPFTADFLQELEHASADDPVTTLTTIESAVTAISGSLAQTGAMDAGSVLALSEALLRDAAARYAEAVRDNEVVDLRKYQAGRGFVIEAEALVRYSSRLKRKPGHEALLESMTLVGQAWPGVLPPPIVYDPPSVARRLDEAVAAMDRLR